MNLEECEGVSEAWSLGELFSFYPGTRTTNFPSSPGRSGSKSSSLPSSVSVVPFLSCSLSVRVSSILTHLWCHLSRFQRLYADRRGQLHILHLSCPLLTCPLQIVPKRPEATGSSRPVGGQRSRSLTPCYHIPIHLLFMLSAQCGRLLCPCWLLISTFSTQWWLNFSWTWPQPFRRGYLRSCCYWYLKPRWDEEPEWEFYQMSWFHVLSFKYLDLKKVFFICVVLDQLIYS